MDIRSNLSNESMCEVGSKWIYDQINQMRE